MARGNNKQYLYNKGHMPNSCGLLHLARYQTGSYVTISCSHHFVVLHKNYANKSGYRSKAL
jgi:hypothetical protein